MGERTPAFLLDTTPPSADDPLSGPAEGAGRPTVYRFDGIGGAHRHRSWNQSFLPTDKNRIVHFVLLDNSLPQHDYGYFDQALLDWLKADLATLARPGVDDKGTNTPVVIAVPRAFGLPGLNVGGVQAFLEAIAPYNVRLILTSGPTDAAWNLNGIPVVASAEQPQRAYTLVEMSADKAVIARNRLRVARFTPGGTTPFTDVLETSLQRPQLLPWTASVSLQPGNNTVTVVREPSMEGTFAYRVNEGPYQPMNADAQGWSAALDPRQFLPGLNTVIVKATYPDVLEPKLAGGRDYLLFVPLLVSGGGSTGKPAWNVNTRDGIVGGFAGENGVLYAGTLSGNVVALDARTGSELWRSTAGSAIYGTPIASGETVYAASSDGTVVALAAKQGTQTWKAAVSAPVLMGPALAAGVVGVVGGDGRIHGFDVASGASLWNVAVSRAAAIAGDGERFFVIGGDGVVRALSARTGEPAWTAGEPSPGPTVRPTIAAAGGRVFVSSWSSPLRALNAATGERIWEAAGEAGYTTPTIVGDRVYAASRAGEVLALDAASGSVLWRIARSGESYVAPVAAATASVVAVSAEGIATHLHAADGTILSRYRCGPGYIIGPPETGDGNVYVAGLDGSVLALPLPAASSASVR